MGERMRSKTRLVAALVGALLVIGCTTSVAAGAGAPVECDITDNTLTCPLPPPPPPVTETETATVTETQQNTVTETATVTTTATVPAGPENLFGDATPANPSDPDNVPIELGVRFKPAVNGVVTGVRFYKGAGNTGTHTGSVWSGNTRVRTVTFTGETDSGWQTAQFPTPLIVTGGTEYVASYLAPVGKYAGDNGYAWPKVSGNLTGMQGLYRYGGGRPTDVYQGSNYYVDVLFIGTGGPTPTTPPTTAPPTSSTAPTTSAQPTTTAPTTTAPPNPPGDWPNGDNTGVPAGTTLTPYSGSTTIDTANTVIDGKTINGDVLIRAAGVKITRSKINGRIDIPDRDNPYSLILEDSEVDAGGSGDVTGVSATNFQIFRTEIVGGNRGVLCSDNCLVQDSWVHGTIVPPDNPAHASGMRASQDTTFRHNRVHCDAIANNLGGGCSAQITMYGDFGPVQNVLIENNLIQADGSSGYCAYGGSSSGKPYSNDTNHVVYKDNVFERGTSGKCGQYGAIVSFDPSRPGNQWINNRWDDGSILNP